jgi:hypothetical protein
MKKSTFIALILLAVVCIAAFLYIEVNRPRFIISGLTEAAKCYEHEKTKTPFYWSRYVPDRCEINEPNLNLFLFPRPVDELGIELEIAGWTGTPQDVEDFKTTEKTGAMVHEFSVFYRPFDFESPGKEIITLRSVHIPKREGKYTKKWATERSGDMLQAAKTAMERYCDFINTKSDYIKGSKKVEESLHSANTKMGCLLDMLLLTGRLGGVPEKYTLNVGDITCSASVHCRSAEQRLSNEGHCCAEINSIARGGVVFEVGNAAIEERGMKLGCLMAYVDDFNEPQLLLLQDTLDEINNHLDAKWRGAQETIP